MAHFHGEMRMERRTGSPSTPPQGAFPKFSPEFPPRISPGQEPQAFVSVCLGALHRLHPCRELSCVAPALLFLHVALPKEPRAPRQGDEVIYLRPDNVLRYISADQLTRFCSDVDGERSAWSSLRGRTLSHRGIQIGHPFIHGARALLAETRGSFNRHKGLRGAWLPSPSAEIRKPL